MNTFIMFTRIKKNNEWKFAIKTFKDGIMTSITIIDLLPEGIEIGVHYTK